MTSYYMISYYIILYYIIIIILYDIILYYNILYDIILYYTILYYIIRYYIILYDIVLYYIILYDIILYYIIRYYIILYDIILYYIIQYYIILYDIILYYTILYYIILYNIILYDIILYYTILYYIILYYIILYYTILYYIILYDIILYYTILHYIILYHIISYIIILYYIVLYILQYIELYIYIYVLLMMVYEYFSQLKFRDKSGPGSDVQSAGSCCSEGGTIRFPWETPMGKPMGKPMVSNGPMGWNIFCGPTIYIDNLGKPDMFCLDIACYLGFWSEENIGVLGIGLMIVVARFDGQNMSGNRSVEKPLSTFWMSQWEIATQILWSSMKCHLAAPFVSSPINIISIHLPPSHGLQSLGHAWLQQLAGWQVQAPSRWLVSLQHSRRLACRCWRHCVGERICEVQWPAEPRRSEPSKERVCSGQGTMGPSWQQQIRQNQRLQVNPSESKGVQIANTDIDTHSPPCSRRQGAGCLFLLGSSKFQVTHWHPWCETCQPV